MTIEQIIVLHLFTNTRVTLQGIGTFHLHSSVPLLPEHNKPEMPSGNTVIFEYNAKAGEDASLVDTIMKQTNKLKPLASADLDSFIHWQKQLLNINMAFKLGNIGILQKTGDGVLQFIPQLLPVAKPGASQKVKIKKAETFTQTSDNNIRPGKEKKGWPAILVSSFVLVLSGWAVYKFAFSNKPVGKVLPQKEAIATPANYTINNVRDTALPRQKSISAPQITKLKKIDSTYIFKVVFLKTEVKEEAKKTLDEIYGFGHSAVMYSDDSLYEIAMPFNRPLSDTLQIMDSLNRYNSLGNGSVETE